jgi:hypothetical protein
MTKQIILHIGTHKTGTSSLQYFLSTYEAELKDAGVLYPLGGRRELSPGRSALAHHALANSLRGKLPSGGRHYWDALLEELARAREETAVVSSEEFSGCEPTHVGQARTHLSAYKVKVVVYLRNRLDFMVSAYKQRVKVGRYRGSFGDFIREDARPAYGELLARWAEVFGAENVLVRVYDKVKKSPGVEEEFLNILGIPASNFPSYFADKPVVNVSPPDDAVMLMRRLNSSKAAWGRKPGAGLFDRARTAVWLGTYKGKALLTACRPFLRGELCSAEDIDWLREKEGRTGSAGLDSFLSAEEQAYLRF